MNKFLTLTALTAALTFAGAAQAGTTQAQRSHNARIAHQTFQAEKATFALTGQTAAYDRAERVAKPYARFIRGGRAAH